MSTRQDLSKHPYYDRWNAMVQKCFSPNNKNYKYYGERGIGVHPDWHPDNPQAVANFVDWFVDQVYLYRKEHGVDPDFRAIKFMRRKMDQDFSPTNCFLGDRILAVQSRTHGKLTFNLVVQLRRFKRANPKATLQLIRDTFDLKTSMSTISRALIGDGWSNVNTVEAPVTRHLCNE